MAKKTSLSKIPMILLTNLSKNEDLRAEIDKREGDGIEKIKIIDELKQEIEVYQERNIGLQNEIKEQQQIIEQYQQESSPKEEMDMSTPRVEENIGQVLVDFELKEKIELIVQLQSELETQKLMCQEKAQMIEELNNTNNDLLSKLESVRNDFDFLVRTSCDLKQQVADLYSKNQSLKEELSLAVAKTEESEKQLCEIKHQMNRELMEKENKMSELQENICSLEGEKKVFEKKMVKANKDYINQLSTNLRDTSYKLLITKNENEELKKTVVELKRILAMHQSVPDSLHRTRPNDQLGLQHQQHGLRGVEEEAATSSRRQSVRTVPSGIGKVFPSEDEAEEMFNNDCLADLKAGRCQVAAGDPNRMSTLMYRNSLCPPHLKSSYPAETQFLPIDTLQEDDIKGRGIGEDTKLLTDKRRKDRTQTSYKRPGPPTPSKNGIRTHLQPTELRHLATPRDALREVNNENRRPGTPGKLFSHIFAARARRNENVTATPDRRRLFDRHFNKEPTE